MRAQAIVAVDGPNVRVSLEKLHGIDATIDYRRLREALWQDAAVWLETAQFRYSTTVFLQTSHRPHQPDDLVRNDYRQVAFDRYLQHAGWQIQKKTRLEYPSALNFVYSILDNALTTDGYRTALLVRRSLREIAGAHHDPWGSLPGDAKQDLQDSARELLRVYGGYYRLRTRIMLRLYLPILIFCSAYAWARQMLEEVLVAAWKDIAAAEQRQPSYIPGVRAALMRAYASNLEWRGKRPAANLMSLSDQELLELARSIRRELQLQRDKLHRAGDVDDILSDWVRSLVRPDVQRKADLPAIVYLVGNDYRNHLVLAERMQRYGAQVVLVVMQRHLVRATATTIAQVQSYPIIWLENFVERGSERWTAA